MSLDEAREFVRSFRFPGDLQQAIDSSSMVKLERVKDLFYKCGLEITPNSSPRISECLEKVKVRLRIPENVVKAFIYASPEIQAQCFSSAESECVIRVSSGLISLMTEKELMFVLGHELGHFLFSHGGKHNQDDEVAYFRSSHAQEISADRVGLVACGALDDAIRAQIKTVSGLGSDHLSFDTNSFIGQLEKISEGGSWVDSASTHPPMVLRARALLWFSLSQFFGSRIANDGLPLEKVDSRVMADLARDRERANRAAMIAARKDLVLWKIAQRIVQKGEFTKVAQAGVKTVLGEELFVKLRNFLGELSVEESNEIVAQRLEAVIEDWRRADLGNLESEIESIELQIKELNI